MRFLVNNFFKDITVLGAHNVPKRGPVILCGNHQNQYVDGSIVYFTSPRDARFMVAAKVRNTISLFKKLTFFFRVCE